MKKLIFTIILVFYILFVCGQKYEYNTVHIYNLQHGMQQQYNELSVKASIVYSSKSVHLTINQPPLVLYCPISFTSDSRENVTTYVSDKEKMMFYNHFNGEYSVWIVGAGDAMYILSNESDKEVQAFYKKNYKSLMDMYSE